MSRTTNGGNSGKNGSVVQVPRPPGDRGERSSRRAPSWSRSVIEAVDALTDVSPNKSEVAKPSRTIRTVSASKIASASTLVFYDS